MFATIATRSIGVACLLVLAVLALCDRSTNSEPIRPTWDLLAAAPTKAPRSHLAGLLSASNNPPEPMEVAPLNPLPEAEPESPAPAPEQQPEKAEAAKPPVPVQIAIEADKVGMIGKRYQMRVIVKSGDVRTITCKVMPDVGEGLLVLQRGKVIDFTNSEPGTFLFIVSAHGADGTGDLALHSLEWKEKPRPQVAAAPVMAAPPAMVTAQPERLPTVEEVIQQYTDDVRSGNKTAERLVWASAFRDVASMHDSRQPVTDNLGAVRQIAASRLGGGLGAWGQWFANIGGVYQQMAQPDANGRRALRTTEDLSTANKRVARVLEGQ